MRHGVANRKLNRTSSHRLAMLENMAVSLIKNETIKTTLPKAKELRPFVEKIITLGKKNKESSRSSAYNTLQDKEAVAKVFKELSVRYKDRNGGYCRIVKAGFRTGDNAPMAFIQLLDQDQSSEVSKTK
jgi:large subunit ribosomal protein L17|tara:strand:+ start:389 stop:775 length:387 start_codon:yes stop_codon:yes gene_type:complete